MSGEETWEVTVSRGRGLKIVLVVLAVVVGAAVLVGPGGGSEPGGDDRLGVDGGVQPDSTLAVDDRPTPSEMPTARQTVQRADGTWMPVAEAPVRWRGRPAAVWSGRELLVWGGTADGAAGAAYDPAEDRWRAIADAPLAPRVGAAAVWAPDIDPGEGREVPGRGELVLWGGTHTQRPHGVTTLRDGAAYDPRTDTWRRLPEAPLSARSGARGMWTGEQVVVLGGWSPRQDRLPDGAAYDPRTDTWTSLPTGPADTVASVWADDRVVAIAQNGMVSAWRPGGDWELQPPVPVEVAPGTVAHGFGGRVALWPGGNGPDRPGGLWLFDVAEGRWGRASTGPLSQRRWPVLESVGDELIVGGGTSRSGPRRHGAVYDLETDTWQLAPRGPAAPRRQPIEALWTGLELLVLDEAADLTLWRPGGRLPQLRATTDAMIHISTERRLFHVEVDSPRTVWQRNVPLSGGDPPLPLAAVQDQIVFHGDQTYAIRAYPRTLRRVGIGAASYFLPAGDAVWLVRGVGAAGEAPGGAQAGGTQQPDDGETVTATKVALSGEQLTAELALPGGTPSASLETGLLLRSGSGWQVHDPITATTVQRGEGPGPFAAGAVVLAECAGEQGPDRTCQEIGLSSAGGGRLGTAQAPTGWSFDLSSGAAAFSPGDARLAVPAVREDSATGVAVVDVATGKVRLAHLHSRQPVRLLAWHPDGSWLFAVSEGELVAVEPAQAQAFTSGIDVPDGSGIAVTASR